SACLGEGCAGRERSEAAAPAPLKYNPRAGAAEAKAYPVASPTPLAKRSSAKLSKRGHPIIINALS
ncbi:MAG: hypothetical protein RML37_12490, partial [Chitinophagales bacterium]|nr:hypothetical protein [Chitinophagales bacterium]